LARPLIRERLRIADTVTLEAEVMAEHEVVLGQLPDVGGAGGRMSEFFMRFMGFIALGRVLARHGASKAAINEIALACFKAQLLAVPEAERLASGRQFLSPENREAIRHGAAKSKSAAAHPGDFVYDYVEPGPGDSFTFGVNYTACGFCKLAEKHGDKDILPSLCGLDFDAYGLRGVHLERTTTLAGGATHCNFRFSPASGRSA
jgi:hypothetical protein